MEKITAGSGGGSREYKKNRVFWNTVHVILDQWLAEIDDRRRPRGKKRVVQQLPRGGAERQRREAALEEGKKRGVDLLDAKQSRGGLVLDETPGPGRTERMADLMKAASSSSPYLELGKRGNRTAGSRREGG